MVAELSRINRIFGSPLVVCSNGLFERFKLPSTPPPPEEELDDEPLDEELLEELLEDELLELLEDELDEEELLDDDPDDPSQAPSKVHSSTPLPSLFSSGCLPLVHHLAVYTEPSYWI